MVGTQKLIFKTLIYVIFVKISSVPKKAISNRNGWKALKHYILLSK
jgi:hypothetical protein